jgi:Holliday junction resolvase RusA-like endonuclease
MSSMYSIEIVINISPTDSNRILGRNHFVKHTIFKKVKTEIAKLSLGKRPKTPLTSYRISATRYSSRFLDFDNLVSSLKPYVDGLTLVGVIKDDKWEYLNQSNYHVDQIKSKDKKIIIKVEEVA